MDKTGAVDFDRIFNPLPAGKSGIQRFYAGDEAEISQRQETPCIRLPRPHRGIARTRVEREAERKRQEQEQYRRGLLEQGEAVRRSGALRAEILKGIRGGEDTAGLLLKACECIAMQTGDRMFYTQAEGDIRSIYGHALGDAYPLQQELTETEGRLARLIRAEAEETDTGQKRRLQGAIAEHRKRIERIRKSL